MAVWLGLVLCSCATEDSHRPTTVKMNKDAGCGSWLVVMVRLDDGEKLPFMVDTGSPITLLDQSLEPKLGKSLGTGTLWHFDVEQKLRSYAVSHLYLGNTLLLTDADFVFTGDFRNYSSVEYGPMMGILGMDILKHYCIQLDFKKGTICFLNDEHANKSAWGKPFPLTEMSDGRFSLKDNLAGIKDSISLIDTGDNSEGWLLSDFFQQWTNHTMQTANSEARDPDGVLDGDIYHDLELKQQSNSNHMLGYNGIGLHFLAKHLVTLDFPKQTMYLKRTGDLPPYNGDALVKPVAQILIAMAKQGRLPGFSKQESGTAVGTIHFTAYPYFDSVTMDARKKSDSSIFSYLFNRTSKDGPWKLQKAWRTDQSGHRIEYNCP